MTPLSLRMLFLVVGLLAVLIYADALCSPETYQDGSRYERNLNAVLSDLRQCYVIGQRINPNVQGRVYCSFSQDECIDGANRLLDDMTGECDRSVRYEPFPPPSKKDWIMLYSAWCLEDSHFYSCFCFVFPCVTCSTRFEFSSSVSINSSDVYGSYYVPSPKMKGDITVNNSDVFGSFYMPPQKIKSDQLEKTFKVEILPSISVVLMSLAASISVNNSLWQLLSAYSENKE